jgi:hypothetical protein
MKVLLKPGVETLAMLETWTLEDCSKSFSSNIERLCIGISE